MYFVKLTNQNGDETYVNLDLATDLAEFGGVTKIYFGDGGSSTVVIESPQEILNSISILKS